MSLLLAVPPEILVKVALETANLDFLGPPRHIVSLFCTCKHIHAVLSRNTNLFARIFQSK